MSTSIKDKGFTLIELLVVLAILTSITSIALLSVGNSLNQQRFDDTKRKIKTIKRAILGNPERSINGSPEISGFVSDIGRLPDCLAELLNREISISICDPNLDADDDPSTQPHVVASAFTYNTTTGLWHGWRGPYINVIADLDGTQRYRDGWNSQTINNTQDSANFGWKNILQSNGDLVLQSRGLDNTENPSTQASYITLNVFEKDYPATTASVATDNFATDPLPVIVSQDYQYKNLTNIIINLVNTDSITSKPALADERLCVVLSYVKDGAITKIATATKTISQNTVGVNNSAPTTFTLLTPVTLTTGHVAYQVKQENTGACGVATGTAYGPFATPQVVTIDSRSTLPLPTIQWVMQL